MSFGALYRTLFAWFVRFFAFFLLTKAMLSVTLLARFDHGVPLMRLVKRLSWGDAMVCMCVVLAAASAQVQAGEGPLPASTSFRFDGVSWDLATADEVEISRITTEWSSLPANPHEASAASIFSGRAWGIDPSTFGMLIARAHTAKTAAGVMKFRDSEKFPSFGVICGISDTWSWYGSPASVVRVEDINTQNVMHRADIRQAVQYYTLTAEPIKALRAATNDADAKPELTTITSGDGRVTRRYTCVFADGDRRASLTQEFSSADEALPEFWRLVLSDPTGNRSLVVQAVVRPWDVKTKTVPTNPQQIEAFYGAALSSPLSIHDARAGRNQDSDSQSASTPFQLDPIPMATIAVAIGLLLIRARTQRSHHETA